MAARVVPSKRRYPFLTGLIETDYNDDEAPPIIGGYIINYALYALEQNVNNLQPNMWRSILANLEAASLYGGDLVELNTIFYTALQSLIVANPPSNGRFVKQNLSQMVYFDVSVSAYLHTSIA